MHERSLDASLHLIDLGAVQREGRQPRDGVSCGGVIFNPNQHGGIVDSALIALEPTKQLGHLGRSESMNAKQRTNTESLIAHVRKMLAKTINGLVLPLDRR